MTDRGLHEMAAKAAGIDGWWEGGYLSFIKRSGGPWRPLADDGDAMRLAVKLGIERVFVLRLGPNGVCVDGAQEPQTVPVFDHSVDRVAFDPYAATRRAIVRAAAEIGKAMP